MIIFKQVVYISEYAGFNLKELQLLGTGTQGRVYKIDNQRCIKVFKSKRECKEEVQSLNIAQEDIHFPKLYKYGQDYIIRELISGVELDKYLETHKLTSQLIIKIIELYESMIKVGYKRLDAAIFHVFVTPSHELKLIDTAKSMKKKTEIPNLLISGIEKAGFKQELFDFLKDTRPDLYEKWRRYKKINYKKIS
ncbi:hypothetical protein HMPREF1982_01679 [Clostridiales bacterium oral taxon 876 str. F0540]|nr:hypothetical protein HMPREF1982_01679 [Clostridiales bacterium oral taxon 876 str. F0540]